MDLNGLTTFNYFCNLLSFSGLSWNKKGREIASLNSQLREMIHQVRVDAAPEESDASTKQAELKASAKAAPDARTRLNYLKEALEIKVYFEGEEVKDADLYGLIGDAYAEVGDLANAGLMYEKCIETLKTRNK